MLVDWQQGNGKLKERFAREVFDGAAGEAALQSTALGQQLQEINEQARFERHSEANAVQCLLKFEICRSAGPDRCASRFAAFTHEDVVLFQAEAFQLIVLEVHLEKVIRLDRTPADVDVSKIGEFPPARMFCAVEHLAEFDLRDLTQRDGRPCDGFRFRDPAHLELVCERSAEQSDLRIVSSRSRI